MVQDAQLAQLAQLAQDARRRGTVVNRLSRPGDRTGTGVAQGAGPGAGGGDSDARYRFLARFGATILSGGIAAIPTSLYHYQAELRLVPQEVWFVGYILAHRWTDALPYPSLRQMSRRTGISTQMLHRYKQSLVEKGYLATIPRHRPSGGRTSNSYDFSGLFARLEQLLRRDRRDPAWQPTADESEELAPDAQDSPDAPVSLEDFEDQGAEEGVAAPAVSAAPQAVPQSQQSASPERGRAQVQVIGGRQRPLSAPDQRRAIDPGRRALPAGAPPPSPAPVIPTGPQESRSLPLRQEEEIQRRAGPSTPFPASGSGSGSLSGRGRTSETRERGERTAGTQERALQNVEQNVRIIGTDPADMRWASACRILAAELTPAAFGAWLRPLTPVALVPDTGPRPMPAGAGQGVHPHPQADSGADRHVEAAPGPGGQRLVLACNTAFHRDHVLRRYRAAIERAAGAACEVVVRPALPESGTQAAPRRRPSLRTPG